MAVLYCDTDCELWFTRAEEEKLGVIEMPYTIDGKEYMYDLGKNTDFKGFFDKMRAGGVPITSALNAENYKEIFEPHFKKGEDILYVAFSSQMSGTFASMDMAVKELSAKYPSVKFVCYDTLSISMGAGLIVYMAAKVFNANGGNIEKTVEYLNGITQKVCTLFVVDDLKYLARGGRISPSKAKMANLFNVKPILTISADGTIDMLSKQSGNKKAMSYVFSQLEEKYRDIDNAPIVLVSADSDNAVEELRARIAEKFPAAEIWIQPVGPVIGAHCGPGTYGLIFTSTSR
ncbi:MAG TPA: DegV family protein [Clostridia bacterium]|nr:DegV family protein [Clostridia bacterium]